MKKSDRMAKTLQVKWECNECQAHGMSESVPSGDVDKDTLAALSHMTCHMCEVHNISITGIDFREKH
jgi:hypothetical protein